MSDDKIRYFQNANDNTRVVYSEGDLAASGMEQLGDPYFTEVQVVPLDAIVIRRDELPEVTSGDRSEVKFGGANRFGTSTWSRAYVEENASEFLAAMLWFKHPPVDEVQVKALKDLRAEWYKRNDSSDLLEFLASRGVRVGDA